MFETNGGPWLAVKMSYFSNISIRLSTNASLSNIAFRFLLPIRVKDPVLNKTIVGKDLSFGRRCMPGKSS